MRVIATAGHVDHGKSTLVKALTGTDPDRLSEEHRRGLTIDLGFAHTSIDGEQFAFVDVPGHQHFIANMLAGIGPAPAVMFVVAADEGWRAQSAEHLAAIDALQITHGILVITRSDLADPGPALAQATAELADSSLAGCPALCVSPVTGAGLPELRAELVRLAERLPEPTTRGRARLWVDRSFTLRGAGTVVSGTLEQGTLRAGERIRLGSRDLTVRRLQTLGADRPSAGAIARVGLNLRSIAAEEIERGDVVTTGQWCWTETVDARILDHTRQIESPKLPQLAMMHIGTRAIQVRIRPLAGDHVRLQWHGPTPLQAGDRMVLRDPGRQLALTGAVVLDPDPPVLERRGAARRRADALTRITRTPAPGELEVTAEVIRRGVMTRDELIRLGGDPQRLEPGVRQQGQWLIAPEVWSRWCERLPRLVEEYAAAHPLQARMPEQVAADRLELPDARLLTALVADCPVQAAQGHLFLPGSRVDLGEAETGLRELEQALADHPFRAPERDDLTRWGIGAKEAAAAVRLGRVIDLGDLVLLGPRAPALAMRELAALPQPFTTSQARQALGSTRRVVIPLLNELDRRGWTRCGEGNLRRVVR